MTRWKMLESAERFEITPCRLMSSRLLFTEPIVAAEEEDVVRCTAELTGRANKTLSVGIHGLDRTQKSFTTRGFFVRLIAS